MALRIKMKDAPPQKPVEEPVEEPIEQPVVEEQQALPAEEEMLSPQGGGTVDPAVARYLGPESRCQGCIHYMEPGSCEIVAGPIDPQGVCSLFVADQLEEMPQEGLAETPIDPIPPDAY